jgi:peptidoglycan/LPS O-acetylase OafA/YrhL
MQNNSVSLRYFPYIDGLRGLAVLSILIFHLGLPFLSGGFVGVDIFFVISGFLITRIIFSEMVEERFSFTAFYARRIKRIFPALFMMLFVCSMAAIVFLGVEQFTTFLKSFRYVSAQGANIFFARDVDYFAEKLDQSPLLHTWSLGVEEQFYLLWPLILFGLFRVSGHGSNVLKFSIPLLALMVVSLGLSEYLVKVDPMQAFYHLHARAWELGVGAILSLPVLPVIKNQKWINFLSLAGLIFIGVSFFVLREDHFPGFAALLPCLGTGLIIYSTQCSGRSIVSNWLSSRILVGVGMISYSLYLWHWPLITFYQEYFNPDLSFIAGVFIFFLSIFMAVLSYFLVERPFRVMKVPPAKTIIVGLCFVAVFIFYANLLKKESYAPWRVSYQMDDIETLPQPLHKICSVKGGVDRIDQCIIGPHPEAYEVLLVGDSHASHFAPMILQWAKQKGLTVRLYTKGACRVWYEEDISSYTRLPPDEYCRRVMIGFRDVLMRQLSVQYVFLGSYAPEGSSEVSRALHEIRSVVPNVFVLGATPVFKNHPHHCEIRKHLLASRYVTGRGMGEGDDCFAYDQEETNRKLEMTEKTFIPMVRDAGVPYFDPLPLLKTTRDAEGHFMFVDTNHLNVYGSLFLVPYFREFIDRLTIEALQ